MQTKASPQPPTSGPQTIKPQAPSGPQAVKDSAASALQRLMKIEGDARRAGSVADLVFLAANETRKLINARQLFVVRVHPKGNVSVEAISSLSAVDREAPAVVWVERLLIRLGREASLNKPHTFRLPAYCDANDAYDDKTYPFPQFKWVPMQGRDGNTFAGMLLTREIPWGESDDVVASRLAEAYAHSWLALEPPATFRLSMALSLRTKAAIAVMLCAAMLFPVSMTVLAPAEIAAVEPFVVAASLDGVIDDILVEPNTAVSAGTPLIRFSDTTARNSLAVAEREVQVADAQLRQTTQAAFSDPEAKRTLAVARADLAVKQAERDFARDLLSKTIISAPRNGLAVFSDKRELVGRPVTVGQRILEIADPARVAVRIEVPVSDAISLAKGSRVRVFLDADPLHPAEAVITRASYTARIKENNVLAFRVDADLVADANAPVLRLGQRGTAQIHGSRVTLFYYLFRRPISYVRQRLGV
ncbi:MAG: HlyD family efflux transporter periplasmic adaptor subunit [Hyphomicrobium sp.]